MNLIAILVAGLAAARLTRLLVDDVILDGPRAWVLDHTAGKLEVLAACPWCLSAYVSAACVALADWSASVPNPVLSWFAAWQLACTGYFLNALLSETGDLVVNVEETQGPQEGEATT